LAVEEFLRVIKSDATQQLQLSVEPMGLGVQLDERCAMIMELEYSSRPSPTQICGSSPEKILKAMLPSTRLELQIRVIKATGLSAAVDVLKRYLPDEGYSYRFGCLSSYCTFELNLGASTKEMRADGRTKMVCQCVNPSYDHFSQVFIENDPYLVSNIRTGSLTLKLWAQLLKRTVVVGSVVIPTACVLTDPRGIHGWFVMRPTENLVLFGKSSHVKSIGYVQVSLTIADLPITPPSDEESSSRFRKRKRPESLDCKGADTSFELQVSLILESITTADPQRNFYALYKLFLTDGQDEILSHSSTYLANKETEFSCSLKETKLQVQLWEETNKMSGVRGDRLVGQSLVDLTGFMRDVKFGKVSEVFLLSISEETGAKLDGICVKILVEAFPNNYDGNHLPAIDDVVLKGAACQ